MMAPELAPHNPASVGMLLQYRFGLGPDTVAALAAALTMRSIPKGTIFARPGTVWTELLFICSGAARSFTVTEKGDEITYFLFFENSWTSDLRSFSGSRPGRFTFEALEPMETAVLDRKNLFRLVRQYPDLAEAVIAMVMENYVSLDKRMESFMVQSPASRYKDFMQDFGDQAARIPQYILASYLGVKPESLSRIRRRLAKKDGS